MPTVPIEKIVSGVTATGDFLVYEVESDRKWHSPYRVDLQKFCGNGQCQCKAFTAIKDVEFNGELLTKKQALLKGAMPNEKLHCKHISKAKRYLIHEVLNRIISDREKQSYENKQLAKKAKETRALATSVSESGEAEYYEEYPLVG